YIKKERKNPMIKYILLDKRFLICLFLINLIGTIYGFIWYESQLAITPAIFLIFVPDSPTASLFFTIFLLFFFFMIYLPYIEVLTVIILYHSTISLVLL